MVSFIAQIYIVWLAGHEFARGFTTGFIVLSALVFSLLITSLVAEAMYPDKR